MTESPRIAAAAVNGGIHMPDLVIFLGRLLRRGFVPAREAQPQQEWGGSEGSRPTGITKAYPCTTLGFSRRLTSANF